MRFLACHFADKGFGCLAMRASIIRMALNSFILALLMMVRPKDRGLSYPIILEISNTKIRQRQEPILDVSTTIFSKALTILERSKHNAASRLGVQMRPTYPSDDEIRAALVDRANEFTRVTGTSI